MTKEEAIHILRDSKPSTISDEEKILERVANVCFAIDMAIGALKERKTGKWVRLESGADGCNQCWTNDFGWARFNYCPKCGAKMKEGE